MKRVVPGLYTEGSKVFTKVGDEFIQASSEKYDKVWRGANNGVFAIKNGFYTILDNKTGKELVPCNIYTFIGEDQYGRRLCKLENKSAIMVNYEVVSPLYDSIRLELNFNIAQLNGVEFMTTGDCRVKVSEGYKKIGRFNHIPQLKRSFADVKGINGKVGTLDSNGGVGIPCEYEKLHTFGLMFKIYELKMKDNSILYGLLAINGEPVTREGYAEYKVSRGRLEMTTPDGEVHIFNSMGQRVKN